MLKVGLIKLGFEPSEVDPCLYIKDNVIIVVYVDDTILWSPDKSAIDKTMTSLQDIGFELTDKGDVDSFLGVKIDQLEDGQGFVMTQPSLIQTIIETIGLENDSKQHKTPAVNPPLQKHTQSEPFNKKWSYRSIIGMLTYLARNTRPDIEYAVHQCARFQCDPRKAHANAIKRIRSYLIGTKDKGLSL